METSDECGKRLWNIQWEWRRGEEFPLIRFSHFTASVSSCTCYFYTRAWLPRSAPEVWRKPGGETLPPRFRLINPKLLGWDKRTCWRRLCGLVLGPGRSTWSPERWDNVAQESWLCFFASVVWDELVMVSGFLWNNQWLEMHSTQLRPPVSSSRSSVHLITDHQTMTWH